MRGIRRLSETGQADLEVLLPRRDAHDLGEFARQPGIRTVVLTGVSVNIAITNLVMESVNRGYDVVLPRDAVCGVPADYADAVIDNTLALLATLTTVDELVRIWES